MVGFFVGPGNYIYNYNYFLSFWPFLEIGIIDATPGVKSSSLLSLFLLSLFLSFSFSQLPLLLLLSPLFFLVCLACVIQSIGNDHPDSRRSIGSSHQVSLIYLHSHVSTLPSISFSLPLPKTLPNALPENSDITLKARRKAQRYGCSPCSPTSQHRKGS